MTDTSKIIVISAPSGGGKTSLISALLNKAPNVAPVVTHTTRGLREGEVDGVHYHFVKPAEFKALIDGGEMIEWSHHYDHDYGTSCSAIEAVRKLGKTPILNVDWKGAESLRRLFPEETLSIFILPPSLKELECRLKARGDSPANIAQRLASAETEISHAGEYDHIITNTHFDEALAELLAVIEGTPPFASKARGQRGQGGSDQIKTAVIGIGYLGRFHAEKYAALKQSHLVALVDWNPEHAKPLAKKLKCEYVQDYKTLIGRVEAVSIVTPTETHFEIAQFFLSHGIHVLLEKPMTVTLEEADQLIKLAKDRKALLQIGYLERFNPIIVKVQSFLEEPKFIESTRIMPFNPRNKDVNVILDLMIHDIDLISTIVNSSLASIDASGASVLSKDIDIASVRLRFENGCVANVTASRISLKPERKLRIFQEDTYFSLDLQNKEASIVRKGKGKSILPGIPSFDREVMKAEERDALKEEIAAFLESILTGTPARVSGEQGKQSLAVALAITEQIHKNGRVQ